MILTDADPDGGHISSLLCSFFMCYLRPLVEQGFVYVVHGPLYSAIKGSERHYGDSLEQLEENLGDLSKWRVVRAKGWGEVNIDVLRDIALNANTRKISQLRLTDTSVVDVKNLMGDDASTRKLLLA
jgi:DNA gyrase/topoisomerase IV subunit B